MRDARLTFDDRVAGHPQQRPPGHPEQAGGLDGRMNRCRASAQIRRPWPNDLALIDQDLIETVEPRCGAPAVPPPSVMPGFCAHPE